MGAVHNYSFNKERAIKQMLEMNKRAKKDDCDKQATHKNKPDTTTKQFPLDSDTIKILSLMLILMGDCEDIMLIFALIYILI